MITPGGDIAPTDTIPLGYYGLDLPDLNDLINMNDNNSVFEMSLMGNPNNNNNNSNNHHHNHMGSVVSMIKKPFLRNEQSESVTVSHGTQPSQVTTGTHTTHTTQTTHSSNLKPITTNQQQQQQSPINNHNNQHFSNNSSLYMQQHFANYSQSGAANFLDIGLLFFVLFLFYF